MINETKVVNDNIKEDEMGDDSTDDDNGIYEDSHLRIDLFAPNNKIQDNPICNTKGCTNPARYLKKCEEHKYKRKICKIEGCTTPSESNLLCGKHGGGTKVVKYCTVEGCTSKSRKNSLCVKHGAPQLLCTVEGCTTPRVNKGKCRKHGAVVKTCVVEGCERYRQYGSPNCITHGAVSPRCIVEGCTRRAKQNNRCVTHGAITKRCNFEGCDKNPVKGGFCISHGGIVKRCTFAGCKNKAKDSNFCIKHGASIKRCEVDGCENFPQSGGRCVRHGGGPRCLNCIDWIDSRVANPIYGDYCATCFKHLFPDDPRSLIYTKTKEIRIRNAINERFTGFVHDTPLYVPACRCDHRRRVDHRKLVGGVMLAIETDEFGHRGYDEKDEEIRYDDLFLVHAGRWHFIRFNPDNRGPDIEDRINELLDRIDELEVRYQNEGMENNEEEWKHGPVKIEYMFYPKKR